jgi:hypothetical protein
MRVPEVVEPQPAVRLLSDLLDRLALGGELGRPLDAVLVTPHRAESMLARLDHLAEQSGSDEGR